jgi:hypothetical protein
MNTRDFVANKTNTSENMWEINKEIKTEKGQKYSLVCSTGKEVNLEIYDDNTYKMEIFGSIRITT